MFKKKTKDHTKKQEQNPNWLDSFLKEQPQEAVSLFYREGTSLLNKAQKILDSARIYVLEMEKEEKLGKRLDSFFETAKVLTGCLNDLLEEDILPRSQQEFLRQTRQSILWVSCSMDTVQAMISLLDKQKNADPTLYEASLNTMEDRLQHHLLELELSWQQASVRPAAAFAQIAA